MSTWMRVSCLTPFYEHGFSDAFETRLCSGRPDLQPRDGEHAHLRGCVTSIRWLSLTNGPPWLTPVRPIECASQLFRFLVGSLSKPASS